MSPTPPTLNPSQTVERIREIIVGRHLEKLEGRVSRLESAPAPSISMPAYVPDIFEDRLLTTEARVEALQDHFHRIEGFREEAEQTASMHRQEAQRLASQINEISRKKAEATALPSVERLERRMGAWLTDWQKSVQSRLEIRDRDLVEKVRAELAELADMGSGIEKRFAELESRVPSNIEDRFNRIAAAARALAESAASISTVTLPKA
jgi:DNA repair exonuclease SbcCD ATPase subunit